MSKPGPLTLKIREQQAVLTALVKKAKAEERAAILAEVQRRLHEYRDGAGGGLAHEGARNALESFKWWLEAK